MAAASCSRCGADGRSVRRRSPRCPITTGSPPWPTDSARRSGTGRRRRRTTRARSSRRRWAECCFTASRAEPWTGTTGWRRAPSPSPAVRARSRPLFASARVVHTGAPLVSPRGWSGTATRDPPGRSKTMSGHHPWSDLTKHFNTEDRKTVQTRAAEILVDSDRRERLRESRPQPSGTGRRRPAQPVPRSSPEAAFAGQPRPSCKHRQLFLLRDRGRDGQACLWGRSPRRPGRIGSAIPIGGGTEEVPHPSVGRT